MNFRVPIKYRVLERLVFDVRSIVRRTHEQRLEYFHFVSIDHIVDEAFKLLCNWYPVTEGVDGQKWAKFAREMRLFPDIHKPKRAAQVDLAFKRRFDATSKERKLDMRLFKQALLEVAQLRYPKLVDDSERALTYVILENVVLVPEVNRRAWKEAKVLAMIGEAKRQCAAIRLQTLHRKVEVLFEYKRHVRAATAMQRLMRRILYRARYERRVEYLACDRIFRVRFSASMRVQNLWRVYLAQKTFRSRIMQAQAEYRARVDARRGVQRERRRTRERAVVFRRVKFVNGILVSATVRRKDPRVSAMNKDYGLIIDAYVPQSQETFRFTIVDWQVRAFLESALNIQGLSAAEILDPKNVVLIADRLMCRMVGGRPIVIFSRRAHGERGTQVLRLGRMISGRVYIITVYVSSDEVVFHAYDAARSATMRTSVTMMHLRTWLKSEAHEERKQEAAARAKQVAEARKLLELERMGVRIEDARLREAYELLEAANAEAAGAPAGEGEEPSTEQDGNDAQRAARQNVVEGADTDSPLLRKENRPELLRWLMARLHVTKRQHGHLAGKAMLRLQYELVEDQRDAAACKLQGMWRCRKARQKVRQILSKQFEKRYDPSSGQYYYVNTETGVMQWDKPVNMGSHDIDAPPDEWQQTTNPETGEVYYMNPATGQTSWLSEEEAARLLQRIVRQHQNADFGKPSFSQMMRAMRIHREAEEKFAQAPDKLASIVNYAMLLHTQRFDFEGARPLYKKAMEISPENPVLLRAYGLFLLASLEPPRQVVYKRALDMLHNAALRDPNREKFQVAEESMFHWAITAQRTHARALLNFALLQQGVVGDYDRAERFYRRALEANSSDLNVIRNWEDFEDQRLPGGAYAGGGPSSMVLRRAKVAETKPEWGEWKSMRDPKARNAKFELFWNNSIRSVSQWEPPKWPEVWEKRKERSTVLNDIGAWTELHDGALDVRYWHNSEDGTYQFKHPLTGESTLGGGGGGGGEPAELEAAGSSSSALVPA